MVKEIKILISEDKLKDAIVKLEELINEYKQLKKLEADVILLSRRLNALESSHIRGTESSAEKTQERNKISEALLKIVAQIEIKSHASPAPDAIKEIKPAGTVTPWLSGKKRIFSFITGLIVLVVALYVFKHNLDNTSPKENGISVVDSKESVSKRFIYSSIKIAQFGHETLHCHLVQPKRELQQHHKNSC